MAHRGGATHPDVAGFENTLAAFEHAVGLGYGYLETDVHVSRDGVLFAFHDESLDRVTDRTGLIAELDAAEIDRARVGGEHPVPRMADLLEHFPDTRFNIDLKSIGAPESLAELLARTGSRQRVCVGSFSPRRLTEFRRATSGNVATSASPPEVAAFVASPSSRLSRALARHPVALQVPHRNGPIPVVTGSFVARAHRAGLHVHVWTIDNRDEMQQLLDLGVDGLITDRTDVLRDVLRERRQWSEDRKDRP